MAKKTMDVTNETQNSAATATTDPAATNTDAVIAAEQSEAVIDEFHGRGGSYVVHDATQTRQPNK